MSERFTKLYELQKNLYSEGSPIVVSAGALLKDTQTNSIIVQLKFHSVSAKVIKALKVGIAAFDIAGKEIAGVSEYQFLDLNIHNGQEFGSNKAIVMPNLVTRSFSIKSITVVLADGCVQSVSLPFSPLPAPKAIQSVLTDAELIMQYKLKTNDSAVYIPQKSLDLWQCHCGEWNSYSVCSKCNGEKSTIFAAFDLPLLTNEMNARLAEDAQRKAEIEQQKAEQARIQAEKKAKRNAAVKKGAKRTLIVIGAIVAVCIALVIVRIIFLFATDKPIDNDFANREVQELHNLTYYVPDNWEYSPDESSEKEKLYTRYDNWGNLLGLMSVLYEGDSPDTSRQNVVSGFEDGSNSSKTQTKTIGKQSFDIVTFTLDSNDGTPFFCNVYITEQNHSVFYIVFSFVEESNIVSVYEEIIAEIAFEEYVNPKEAIYAEAAALLADGEYENALSKFAEIDGYKDTGDKIKACEYGISCKKYDDAIQLMADGHFVDAIAIFEELGNHEDSSLQLKKARYGRADQLFNQKSYTEAADIFASLGDYEDSSTRYADTVYNYALSLMQDASYNDAIVLFGQLDGYSASIEMIQECRYLWAKEHINSYDYDAAQEQLMSIKGYKDSADYLNLINDIISRVYYNDEYSGTHYIWVVSRIDTVSCTEVLNFYKCRDDLGLDDEFVDYYQGHNVQWKTSGTKIFASSDGQAAENGYTLYDLSAGRNILTSQYISTDGEAKVVDTYKLMPDGRAQYIKEEWVSYLENNEGDDAWKTAEATVEIIDDYSNVDKTSDGIEFYVNGLRWTMPDGWSAVLNSDATVALVTFSEGEYWGDTDRIYISYEGQYSNLTEYMQKNKTNGTFSRINVEGCSEAYICYEGLLDEDDFESNTAYVICNGSVFKVSYVADNGWYNETQVKGTLAGADFSSYSFE